MAHRVYRMEQGNGYATRTIDTWTKAEPVITVFWFLDPPRMHRMTRPAAAQQLMEQRRAGLPITRNVIDDDDSLGEYPNLTAQLAIAGES